MKSVLIAVLVILVKISLLYSQTYNQDSILSFNQFARPRIPYETSFYSNEMWKNDGLRYEYEEYTNLFTLWGLEGIVKTNNRTIVYDASVMVVPEFNEPIKDGIVVQPNSVLVTKDYKKLLIPIEYKRNNNIVFTNAEKILISEYVAKGLSHIAATPAKILIESNGEDFNIKLIKSIFTNEDIILEGFNLRSRTDKEESLKDLKQFINNNRLEEANTLIKRVYEKYPDSEDFDPLIEKLESLNFISSVNKRSSNTAIIYIEEGITDFAAYDGVNPMNYYKDGIVDKQSFIDNLLNTIGANVNVIYLDMKSQNDDKAEIFVSTIGTNLNYKLINQNRNIVVKRLPIDEDEKTKGVYFEGIVQNPIQNSFTKINDYKATQTYDLIYKGILKKVKLGIEIVHPRFIKKQAEKFIHNYFKIFDNTIEKKNKKWNLSDAVYDTRQRLENKYKKNKKDNINPSDYENFIDELGKINIVFIEESNQPNLAKNE